MPDKPIEISVFVATNALVQRVLAAKRDLRLVHEFAVLDGVELCPALPPSTPPAACARAWRDRRGARDLAGRIRQRDRRLPPGDRRGAEYASAAERSAWNPWRPS
jgi:hypothetical protein